MATATTTTTIPIALASEAELVARLAQTAGVAVLEVYSEHWGPCKSILAALKKLQSENSDNSAPLSFFAVPAERVRCSNGSNGPAQQVLAQIAARARKSEPFFLVFRGGLLKATLTGVDVPRLVGAIEGAVAAGGAVVSGGGKGVGGGGHEAGAGEDDGDKDEQQEQGSSSAAVVANPFKALVAV
jgi:hypothetical protein